MGQYKTKINVIHNYFYLGANQGLCKRRREPNENDFLSFWLALMLTIYALGPALIITGVINYMNESVIIENDLNKLTILKNQMLVSIELVIVGIIIETIAFTYFWLKLRKISENRKIFGSGVQSAPN